MTSSFLPVFTDCNVMNAELRTNFAQLVTRSTQLLKSLDLKPIKVAPPHTKIYSSSLC
jgi:hypothetical protein